MRVEADLDLCQGHGMCVLEAPDVFALGKDDDQVRILQGEPDESRRDAVRKAVGYCPTMALEVHD
jgi:ferredoxin